MQRCDRHACKGLSPQARHAAGGAPATGTGPLTGGLLPAQVRRGDLVFDPFSGTGSILVAAASLGALTLGADIDIRVLRDGRADARGKARAHACPVTQ